MLILIFKIRQLIYSIIRLNFISNQKEKPIEFWFDTKWRQKTIPFNKHQSGEFK